MDNYWNNIAKYLSGDMDEIEKNEFKEWLDSDIKNKELYDSVKKDWDSFDQLPVDIDSDKAWNNLENRLRNDSLLPDNKLLKISPTFKIILQTAAALLILITSVFVFNTIKEASYFTIVKTKKFDSRTIQLADGSIVYLNQNSKLKYPKTFGNSVRNVILEGEAFFEITKQEGIPFIVNTKTAEIKVLGTSFNVNTRLNKKNVEVFVKTGKVQVTSLIDNQSTILLEKGDVGISEEGAIKKNTEINENVIAWKTKELVFKNTNLEEVINVIENVYLVDLKYKKDDIKDLQITTTFHNQSLESVLKVICRTFNLSFKKSQNNVYIEKERKDNN